MYVGRKFWQRSEAISASLLRIYGVCVAYEKWKAGSSPTARNRYCSKIDATLPCLRKRTCCTLHFDCLSDRYCICQDARARTEQSLCQCWLVIEPLCVACTDNGPRNVDFTHFQISAILRHAVVWTGSTILLISASAPASWSLRTTAHAYAYLD